MYRLKQKIRMGNRASCNNQLRTEGESKSEIATLSQSSPATIALRTPLLQVQRGGLGGSVFLLLLFHQQLAVPSVVGVCYEHIKKIFLVYTTKKIALQIECNFQKFASFLFLDVNYLCLY